MAFDFLSTLTESKLFPTRHSLVNHTPRQIADLTHLYMCAMRVLLLEEHTESWARSYCHRTIQHGNFDRWRTDGNDLYQLLHSMNVISDADRRWKSFHVQNVLFWLRDSVNSARESLIRTIFVRIDYDLDIRDDMMRSIRRLVRDWPTLDMRNKKLVMINLILMFRRKAPKSELLPFLERASRLGLSILEEEILAEDDAASTTSSADVATVVTPLGFGIQKRKNQA